MTEPSDPRPVDTPPAADIHAAPIDLRDGINFFSQLLSAHPEDLTALTYLTLAYDLAEQPEQRNRYIPRLAAAFLRQRDPTQAERVLHLLPENQLDDPAIQMLLKRIDVVRGVEAYRLQAQANTQPEKVKPSRPATETQTVTPEDDDPTHLTIDACIQNETRCLDWLLNHRLVNEAMAEEVRKRLAGHLTPKSSETISTLQIIEEVDGSQLEHCLAGIVQHGNVTPVPVERFHIEESLRALFSEREIRMRGVVPFATMGENVLVATLNPVDDAALEQLAMRLNRPCFFYLMRPSSFRAVCNDWFTAE